MQIPYFSSLTILCCSALTGIDIAGRLGTAAGAKGMRTVYGAAGTRRKDEEEEEDEEEEDSLSIYSLLGFLQNFGQQHKATKNSPV